MLIARVNLFAGEIRRLHPRLLPPQYGQRALNAKLWHGDLRPWRDPLFVVTPTKSGTKKTIYRFGQTETNQANYWFHWTTDVNVARGPVAADTLERTYYTGDGIPKVTANTIALAGGTDYPMASYTLGLPAPGNTPTATLGSGGSGVAVARNYVYCFVSGWGEIGPPSLPSATVTALPGQTVTVGNMSTAPGGGTNVTAKNIYRAQVGRTGAAFVFVAQVAAATTSYDDTLLDTQLGLDELPSETWVQPPADMHSLIALPNGNMAGLSKNDVCFSEPNVPHAWPLEYRISVDYPGVALGAVGESLVVGTTGYPYLITGTDPLSMKMTRIDERQACVSKRSMVDLGFASVYASPDGLMQVGVGGARLATEGILTRDDWQALKPESIDGYQLDGRYFGFYNTGSVAGGFVFDAKDGKPSLSFTDVVATAGYNDPIRDGLYLQIGADIRRWDAGAGLLTEIWKSKVFVAPRGVNCGGAQVEASTYPLTFKLYAGGALTLTKTVASPEPFRCPGGYKAREFEFEVSGTSQNIKQVVLAETMADIQQVAA